MGRYRNLRYRASKRRARELRALFVIGWMTLFTVLLSRWFVSLWSSARGKIGLIGSLAFLFLIGAWQVARRLRERRKLAKAIANLDVSDKRSDYFIEDDDYRRVNPKESLYRKLFQLTLLEMYLNRCAKCESKSNGIDLDHFFMSKSEGACFIMRHRDGYLVNNAIPLCQTCNRSKSDKSFRKFFTKQEILFLLQKNAVLTKRLNEAQVLRLIAEKLVA